MTPCSVIGRHQAVCSHIPRGTLFVVNVVASFIPTDPRLSLPFRAEGDPVLSGGLAPC